jgi:hypothetical protein
MTQKTRSLRLHFAANLASGAQGRSACRRMSWLISPASTTPSSVRLSAASATSRSTTSSARPTRAAACGVNRSTVLRAIKSGRISGQRDDAGVWTVEPAELHRIFPPAPAEAAPKAVQQDAQADALVALLREQLSEMRSDRDAWREQAQRLISALPKPASEPAEAKKPRTWWQRLRSTA